MESPDPQQTPEKLLALSAEILLPLVRLLMSHNVMMPSVAEMLKQVYVQAADEYFTLHGKALTDSRVALLTGVHRKDVKRLRHSTAQPSSASQRSQSVISAVVAQWMTHPDFLTAQKQPLPLGKSPKFGSPNFAELVQTVSRDLRARAVLDELERLGLVREDPEGKVHLDKIAPNSTSEQFLDLFAQNARDHLAAAVHNMLGGGSKMLEQSIFTRKLSAADAQALEQLARTLWKKTAEAFVPQAQEAAARCDAPLEQRYRINFGTYFLLEPANAPANPVSNNSDSGETE